MDISYRKELVKEPTSKARLALCSLVWAYLEGGALDRLSDDQDVAAARVLVELDELLAHEGEITRAAVDKERAVLEDFRKMVLRHVELEKAQKIADKLIMQARKADLGYRAIQSLVVRRMDRMYIEWPDEG